MPNSCPSRRLYAAFRIRTNLKRELNVYYTVASYSIGVVLFEYLRADAFGIFQLVPVSVSDFLNDAISRPGQ